jgi:hypothetical protein
VFQSLGGSGGGDSKPAVSYSAMEETQFAVPRFWPWICCLSGSADGDSCVFSLLFSKSWVPKLLALNLGYRCRYSRHSISRMPKKM